MRGRIMLLFSIVSCIGILAMLNFTTPTGVGVIGVLVFFTMIFIILFTLMYYVIKIFQRILKDKKSVRSYSENKTCAYALVLAFAPLMLLIANPSSSVNIVTIGLLIVFVLVGCFFVHKRL
ncbi:hypothetical protein IKG02_00765 [Candidatus Saccharibacteria bacterium]|nr:hypothetical protein [Candidatus Saccharibacteria bacterium]